MGDCISRQAVLDTLDTSDRFMDEERTVENYKALLKECYEVLPPVTPKQRMCFDGMTNGEVIQALFPKAEVYVQEWKDFKSIVVWFENAQVSHDFTWDWWNAPYKAERSDKE